MLAVASGGDVVLYRPAHLRELARLPRDDGSGWVRDVEFSHDGALLAAADFESDVVVVWDVATGRQHLTVNVPAPGSVAFSAHDAALYTASEHGLVRPRRRRDVPRRHSAGCCRRR